jgi:hypothetical protein
MRETVSASFRAQPAANTPQMCKLRAGRADKPNQPALLFPPARTIQERLFSTRPIRQGYNLKYDH